MSVAFGLRFWPGSGPIAYGIRTVSREIAGGDVPRLRAGEKHAQHVSLEIWRKHGKSYVECAGVEGRPPRARRYDPRDAGDDTRLYILPDPQHPRGFVRPDMPCSPRALAEDLFATAEEHVGEAYDLLGFALALYYGYRHQPTRFMSNPDARIYCSGLVEVVLDKHGILLYPDHRPPCNSTPMSAEYQIQRLGWTRVQ